MSISTLARVFTPHGNIVYTANDFRQTLRIVFAGMIALSISSFYNTSYGVFFVVYPIMLLSLVPVFNRHVAKQFIFSASLNCIEMVFIIGYLSQWPVIMTLVVFALYVMRFRFMSKAAVPVRLDGRGLPERDAQLYELPHHQLAHAFIL